MDTERDAFTVAVVGSQDVMTTEEVGRLLDLLVNRQTRNKRIVLLTPGGHFDVATDWARHRGHSVMLIPKCGNRVKQDCELVAHADSVVVVGNPGPWQRLIRLAGEAGVPVRVYRERPRRLPPPIRDDDWIPPAQWPA